MATPEFERGGPVNFLIDLPVRALFGLVALLPYRTSLTFAGWITTRLLAPFFGINTRIRKNLRHIWPNMPGAEMTRLCHEVSDNSARLLVESFVTETFIKHARRASFGGAGKTTLLNALAANKPVILVSGHFGNYQAIRVLLGDLGFATAAIYRPMNNAYTNTRYINNMNKIATPNHARGLKGTKNLLQHLRKGGAIALLNDQAAGEGATLNFMGQPALTMTSAAEFALKYNALLFPYYGTRLPNGVDFKIEVEPPIVASDATTMTQDLNDSLEARVREHPGQWFWMHRRWKGL
jgi:KDO2-lipid IV(A) lauroyltransferase